MPSGLSPLDDKGKKVRDQMVPRMSLGPPPLDDKRMQNDHNLSLRAIGHDYVWMAKGDWNDHNLSLRVIGFAASR